jgi:hypothetical protein
MVNIYVYLSGIVPNDEGRVLSDTSDTTALEEGLYVCGWLKRGPTGIVATNLYCAEETVCVSFFSIHIIPKTAKLTEVANLTVFTFFIRILKAEFEVVSSIVGFCS